MTDSDKKDNEIVDKFFRREPIAYESQRNKVKVKLTIQEKGDSPWKYGIDHLCYADLNIEFLIGYNGSANRNSSLGWSPRYIHVDSGDICSFGGLFEKMHNYSESFSQLLSNENNQLSTHDLRRTFDSIEDQFKKDFDNPEFKKHFAYSKK